MVKHFHLRLFLLYALLGAGLSGCLKDSCESTQIFFRFDPIYMTRSEIVAGFGMEGARPLEQPGKIYYYQDYLLINERYEGVHIIDNKDPENPVHLSFVSIPGNVDMAVRGDLLYADSYVDLLTLDISDPLNPRLLSRSEDVFPLYGTEQSGRILVRYEQTQVTREVACNENAGNFFFQDDALFFNASAASEAVSVDRAVANATGVGGSLARFTIVDKHLYAVDNTSLHVFGLSNPAQPTRVNTVGIGWAIETIFPYGDNLFIGSQSGMFIFDNRRPEEPVLLSVFQHATACDPVFVDGTIAYVTLRDGTECQTFTNQLDVVDVSNLMNPRLLYTYPMHRPAGLSIQSDHLYLCEDDQGLKVFDVSDLAKIDERMVDHERGFRAYDVITLDKGSEKIAMVIGEDGLYQFDISDPSNLRQLSVLTVNGN